MNFPRFTHKFFPMQPSIPFAYGPAPAGADVSSAHDRPAPAVTVGPVSVAVGGLTTTNEALAERFERAPEVILRKIGIESRPLAPADMTPKALALEAVAPLLDDRGFDPAALAMIVTTSSSITQVCPPVSCEVLSAIARRFPATPPAMAFDILATCTGWLYALSLVSDHLHQPAHRAGAALIVTTEIFTQGLADDDFAAWASFGDAATATLVYGPDAPQGARPGFIQVRRPVNFARPDTQGALWGPPLRMAERMKMDGYAVRQHSMPAMAEALRAALADAGLSAGELRAVFAHQSNHRILAELAAELGVDPALVPSNLRFRGNSSSSALPLLLHDLRTAESAAPGAVVGSLPAAGSLVGFTAFGGGFTFGAAIGRML